MHDIHADLNKNRIYISIGKIENESEMQAIVDKVKSECPKLKTGFTCLTDLRYYEYQDEIFEKYIKEAQEALLAQGMSKVVRVHRKVGMLGHLQFETVSLDLGYRAKNVTSMEEAEKILDGQASE
jgi:CTP synthase (UTP-ammonia lyase)